MNVNTDFPSGFDSAGNNSFGSAFNMSLELPDVIDAGSVQEYVHDVVWPAFLTERRRLERFAWWARGNQPDYLVAPVANFEKRALLALSKTPWLKLVVTTFTQALYVDGYRGAGAKVNSPGPWETWCANGLQSRQIGIHRAAMTYGYSYARALIGTALDGKDQATLRGLSPRRMFCLYEDSVADDYPRYALELMPDGQTVRFYDNQVYYELEMPTSGDFPTMPEVIYHGSGVVPVVRYLNEVDLDGHVMGEIEALIRPANRLDKTDYDRMLIQHYNSWRIRTATGIDDLSDASDEVAAAAKLKLEHDSVLAHTNPEVRFSTLEQTSMDGILEAHNTDVETLAANAQLPAHILTGRMANLSAEALSAARASTTQKLFERQMTFGQSHSQLLRLAAHIEGDKAGAEDFTAGVTWSDLEVRSLSQAADAYGKVALQLGVPKWALWSKLPGVSSAEAQMWYEHVMDTDPEAGFLRYYDNKDPAAKASPGVTANFPGTPGAQPTL